MRGNRAGEVSGAAVVKHDVRPPPEILDQMPPSNHRLEQETLQATMTGREPHVGQLKAHPAVEIERQSTLVCVRVLRELGLDSATTSDCEQAEGAEAE